MGDGHSGKVDEYLRRITDIAFELEEERRVANVFSKDSSPRDIITIPESISKPPPSYHLHEVRNNDTSNALQNKDRGILGFSHEGTHRTAVQKPGCERNGLDIQRTLTYATNARPRLDGFGSNMVEGSEAENGTGIDTPLLVYKMGNEPDRKLFLDDLFHHEQCRGSPILKVPLRMNKPVDLYKLFHIVVGLGGALRVSQHSWWKTVADILDHPVLVIGQSNPTKAQYCKLLYPYECSRYNLSRPEQLRGTLEGSMKCLISTSDTLSGHPEMSYWALRPQPICSYAPSPVGVSVVPPNAVVFRPECPMSFNVSPQTAAYLLSDDRRRFSHAPAPTTLQYIQPFHQNFLLNTPVVQLRESVPTPYPPPPSYISHGFGREIPGGLSNIVRFSYHPLRKRSFSPSDGEEITAWNQRKGIASKAVAYGNPKQSAQIMLPNMSAAQNLTHQTHKDFSKKPRFELMLDGPVYQGRFNVDRK